jgi:hypothetical protein
MKKTLSVLAALGLVLGMSSMAMAVTATGTMTTQANLTNACTVSDALMDFGNIAGLVSTGDVTADTAGSLMVACTTGVAPTIWSDTARAMTNGTETIAFNLSQTSGAAADDLAIAGTGDAFASYVSTGSPIAVPLYGMISAAALEGKPAGAYTVGITVSVDY